MPPIPAKDPFDLFQEWYADAEKGEPKYPDAMMLATVDGDGLPDLRTVLLKGFDHQGFVFYTNFESAKGRELLAHGKAALNFYWKSTDRQVRIRGTISTVTAQEADEYFASRPRISQLGAWASKQSQVIDSRAVLEARLKEAEARFEGRAVERPPHWSGFRLTPVQIEFWSEGEYRLHDRRLYTHTNGEWTSVVLSP